MSGPTKFSVLSLNTFNNKGTNLDYHLYKKLNKLQPDLIFVQEAPRIEVFKTMRLLDIYELVYIYQAKKGYPLLLTERLATLIHRNSRFKLIKTIEIISSQCHTPRLVTYQDFSDGNVNISIGNVHLCGGFFDEKYLTNSDYDIEDLENIKVESLEELIGLDVDIILGDFNSDALILNNNNLANNEEYLLKQGGIWNQSSIYEWNIAPYSFLQDNYYDRVPNWKTTSYFGGSIDNIYYRPGIDLYNYGILNFVLPRSKGYQKYDGASDHNGIYAVFNLLAYDDKFSQISIDSSSSSDDCGSNYTGENYSDIISGKDDPIQFTFPYSRNKRYNENPIYSKTEEQKLCQYGHKFKLGGNWNPGINKPIIDKLSNEKNDNSTSEYTISNNGIRYKNNRIVMYHGTSRIIWLRNKNIMIDRYKNLCVNASKELINIYEYVSKATMDVNKINKGLFLTTSPGLAIKYAIPDCKKNESCGNKKNIARNELCKIGGILLEISLDPDLVSGWAFRDSECDIYRRQSPELGITNRNELYKRDGFDIMRDLGAIEEYFVVNSDIFTDINKDGEPLVKVENIYKLNNKINYIDAVYGKSGDKKVQDNQNKRVQSIDDC